MINDAEEIRLSIRVRKECHPALFEQLKGLNKARRADLIKALLSIGYVAKDGTSKNLDVNANESVNKKGKGENKKTFEVKSSHLENGVEVKKDGDEPEAIESGIGISYSVEAFS